MKRFLHVKIRCTSFVALAVFIVAGPIRAQSSASPAKELTVERIYSAPSLSGHLTDGMEWTPDSRSISYHRAHWIRPGCAGGTLDDGWRNRRAKSARWRGCR